MLQEEILLYLFDGKPHILTPSMETWLASSRRYTDFVTTFRDKIRKKIRSTQEEGNLLDLRLELETAYKLLQERTLSLMYEPYRAEGIRGPDFAVTYTTSLTFMLEVTRMRAEADFESMSTPQADRLADTVCGKLRQLLPQQCNALLVGVDRFHLTESDVRAAMLRVQQRAEQSDSKFVQRFRFRDRADFFNHY